MLSRHERRTATLLVGLAVLSLAGCSALLPGGAPTASPTPEPPDIAVTVANEGTGEVSYTITFGIVPGRVDAVRETTTEGETRTVENLTARAGANLFRPTDVVAVDPVGDLDIEGEFTLRAGDRVTGTIEDPPRAATLFVYARSDDRVVAWGSADCGDDESLTSVDFSVDDRGPGLSVGCTFRGLPESGGRG